MVPVKKKKKAAAKAATKRAPAKKKVARRKASAGSPIGEMRRLCLALPEAHEVEAWEAPTFRVKNKLFAMFAAEGNHHHGGRPGAWIKSDHNSQEFLIASDPKRFFKPPYVGPSGWVGVFLDARPNWRQVDLLLRDAWRMTAPKKMLALLND